MSTMLYKQGTGTKVWGKKYQTVIVGDDEVSDYLKNGWHKHPDDVPEAKPETKKITRTRTTKAENDESDD